MADGRTVREVATEAEGTLVLADEAEAACDLGRSQYLARVAGSQYERAAIAAIAAESPALAASCYRLAQRAYRRGQSTGRAFRMGSRAAKCDAVENAGTAEERSNARRQLRMPEAA